MQINATVGALIFSIGQQFAFDDAELREVIVFAFARKHVEIEQAERLAGFRVGDGVELQIADPFVRRFDALEFQAEDALVNREHAVEHALVGEINAQLLGIDGVFLLSSTGC